MCCLLVVCLVLSCCPPPMNTCGVRVQIYLSFFLGLRLLLWPQDFFLQLVALGWSLA